MPYYDVDSLVSILDLTVVSHKILYNELGEALLCI